MSRAGVGIVEVLLSLLLVTVLAGPLAGLVLAAQRQGQRAHELRIALSVARDVADSLVWHRSSGSGARVGAGWVARWSAGPQGFLDLVVAVGDTAHPDVQVWVGPADRSAP